MAINVYHICPEARRALPALFSDVEIECRTGHEWQPVIYLALATRRRAISTAVVAM
jgi:hypothetical protein